MRSCLVVQVAFALLTLSLANAQTMAVLQGRVLDPGVYVLRLRAQPVDGGDGELPSTAEAVFRILR